MSRCPTCGAKQNSGTKILLWCFGLLLAGLASVPIMIIVILVAVASVGSNLTDEFETIATEIEAKQVARGQDFDFSEFNSAFGTSD